LATLSIPMRSRVVRFYNRECFDQQSASHKDVIFSCLCFFAVRACDRLATKIHAKKKGKRFNSTDPRDPRVEDTENHVHTTAKKKRHAVVPGLAADRSCGRGIRRRRCRSRTWPRGRADDDDQRLRRRAEKGQGLGRALRLGAGPRSVAAPRSGGERGGRGALRGAVAPARAAAHLSSRSKDVGNALVSHR
jgi:hypothetical protein